MTVEGAGRKSNCWKYPLESSLHGEGNRDRCCFMAPMTFMLFVLHVGCRSPKVFVTALALTSSTSITTKEENEATKSKIVAQSPWRVKDVVWI